MPPKQLGTVCASRAAALAGLNCTEDAPGSRAAGLERSCDDPFPFGGKCRGGAFDLPELSHSQSVS